MCARRNAGPLCRSSCIAGDIMALRSLAAVLTMTLAATTASAASDGWVPPATEGPVEIAARSYRLQVYETFHADRAEFDGRLAKWSTLYAKWEQHGKPQRWETGLVHWLEDATARSKSDAIQPLPPEPLGVVMDANPQLDSAASMKSLADAPDESFLDGPASDESPRSENPAAKSSTIAADSPTTNKNSPAEKNSAAQTATTPEQQTSGAAAAITSFTRKAPNLIEGAASWLESVGHDVGDDVGNLLGAAAPGGK